MLLRGEIIPVATAAAVHEGDAGAQGAIVAPTALQILARTRVQFQCTEIYTEEANELIIIK